eukprot:GHVR01179332.1.p1 GENE.GHVR01179332.1~~GHVR01179332.1.p1  ORF type:complete len:298 (+),score=52.01 GHVR01179332.1:1007-1900(+)
MTNNNGGLKHTGSRKPFYHPYQSNLENISQWSQPPDPLLFPCELNCEICGISSPVDSTVAVRACSLGCARKTRTAFEALRGQYFELQNRYTRVLEQTVALQTNKDAQNRAQRQKSKQQKHENKVDTDWYKNRDMNQMNSANSTTGEVSISDRTASLISVKDKQNTSIKNPNEDFNLMHKQLDESSDSYPSEEGKLNITDIYDIKDVYGDGWMTPLDKLPDPQRYRTCTTPCAQGVGNHAKCKWRNSCFYAHYYYELQRYDTFRTRVCKSYAQTGVCEYGDTCVFSHDISNTEQVPTS